mgnify:CR=1 FL=1
MIHFQTAIVYFGLLFIMVGLGKLSCKISKKRINGEIKNVVNKKNWKYCLLAVFIFSVVMGLRYGVGVDFFTYGYAYDLFLKYGLGGYTEYSTFEPGFSLLMMVLAVMKMPAPVFYGVVAFLQLFFLSLILKKQKFLIPYLFFAFISTGLILDYANIMRQALAISIGLYSITFIVQKKPIIHYALLSFAVLMHYSTILLFVLYPIFSRKQNWFSNRSIQIALIGVSLLLMRFSLIQEVLARIDVLATMLGYGGYLNDERMEIDTKLGLGFLLTLVHFLIIIWFSEDAKKFFRNKYFEIVYSIFIVGLFLNYCFINSMLLQRIVILFYYSYVVVDAFMLFYFFKKHRLIFYSLSMIMILLMLSPIMGGVESPHSFVFVWQDGWCKMKEMYLYPSKLLTN